MRKIEPTAKINRSLGIVMHAVRPGNVRASIERLIEYSFTKEQLALLYRILDSIEEEGPPEGRNRAQILDDRKAWKKIHEYRSVN